MPPPALPIFSPGSSSSFYLRSPQVRGAPRFAGGGGDEDAGPGIPSRGAGGLRRRGDGPAPPTPCGSSSRSPTSGGRGGHATSSSIRSSIISRSGGRLGDDGPGNGSSRGFVSARYKRNWLSVYPASSGSVCVSNSSRRNPYRSYRSYCHAVSRHVASGNF